MSSSDLFDSVVSPPAPTCLLCNTVIATKSITCTRCRTIYHPSCAMITGKTPEGAFNKCCADLTPANQTLESFKELLVDELKNDFKDMISKTMKESVKDSL